MKTILLDTNILLQTDVDILQELQHLCDFPYEVAILDRTLKELEHKKQERFARALLAKKHIKTISTNSPTRNVDQLLVELAPKHGYIVVTQDKKLKEELVQNNVEVITIRQHKTLRFVNPHVL